jgi:apolipoprotein D and lipocalin family protein
MKTVKFLQLMLLPVLLSACVGMPEGVKPVNNFELDRYLGKWYEIARLDHSFERGMQQVTAEYSLREDGGVRVLNRGYLEKKDQWKESEGKAYFVEDAKTGYLKVSFFGPFYGSYIVFGLEQADYSYTFVSGPDTSYLWLLSREPEVDDEVMEQFREQATTLGFNLDELILVEHSSVD